MMSKRQATKECQQEATHLTSKNGQNETILVCDTGDKTEQKDYYKSQIVVPSRRGGGGCNGKDKGCDQITGKVVSAHLGQR